MLRDREYVYAVYQELSFSRAAQKLFISQPALSSKIKKVEERVGMPLFDRSTNPISLTTAGRCYIDAVEQVTASEDELNARLGQLSLQKEGTVTVGSATYFCSYILPELALQFQQQRPSATVALLEGNIGDLTQNLLSGVVDFVLDVDDLELPQFERQFWSQEELLLAVPAHLPINDELSPYRLSFEQAMAGKNLTPDVPRVSLSAFQNENFLLLTKGNDLHRRALSMCRAAGFKPQVLMYLDQMLTSYHVAENGHGVTFIRSGVLEHVKPCDRLYFYRLDDPSVFRNLYLYRRKETPMSLLGQEFWDFMCQKEPV